VFAGLPLTDHNLILTGYSGSNLPRIGLKAAERLKMPFVNLDVLISERLGVSGEELRDIYGERRLKAVEADLMAETVLRRQSVIRVGARTVLQADHAQRLAQTGTIFALVTSLDAVLRRLHIQMGGRYADPNERARELGDLRQEWPLRELGGVQLLDVTRLSEAETLDHIVEQYRQRAIPRA
jgi:shikimate kinase